MSLPKEPEIWEPIAGYEDAYEVSNFGSVRSVRRLAKIRGNKLRTVNSRILKPRANRKGYLSINLYKSGRAKTFQVHRLVAYAFLGEIPKGFHVCHKDGNPQNNFISNLRIDTPKSNQADREIHGTDCKGSKHARSKLVEPQVLVIRQLLKSGEAQKEVADKFNVSCSTVGFIGARKTWKHI